MQKEGQPNPSEMADMGVESQESQPTSPEESVEKVEKPLDGAQAEQMTVELQGELGSTANALLKRAEQAGLAEDADVQGLLGEFAQLSEQLGTALEDFKAEAARAEEGAAKIAAAHEAMPDIVGAEQVAKAQAGVEAAQAKVAQGEAAKQTLQAEQARVEGVLEERVNEVPDATKEGESSVESIAGRLRERFDAAKDALSSTFLKKMYEVRISALQAIVDGKDNQKLDFDLYPTPNADEYLDANGQDAKQKERDLEALLGRLNKVVDKDGNVDDRALEELEERSSVPGVRDALSELRGSLESARTVGVRAYEKITEQMTKDERRIFETADLDQIGELTSEQKDDILAKRLEVFQSAVGMNVETADALKNPDASDELKDKMRKGEVGWKYALKHELILGVNEQFKNGSRETTSLKAQDWKKRRQEIRSSVFQKYREALDRTKGALEANRTSAKESEAFINDSASIESLKVDTMAEVDKLKKIFAQ